LEKEKSGRMIAEAAKTIFSYCRARTSSKEEAEDLSQDILLELLKTRENLRDDKAFYGFMWAVASNIYKNWCKKRGRFTEAELEENVADKGVPFAELLEKEGDIRLLYRELSLLGEQYRKVMVLYYFDSLKVSEISNTLGISQSMVKFLLFKSRKILREGMSMERRKGNRSFDPGRLWLSLLQENQNPEDVHSISALFGDNLLAQNILLACYNDRCTAEEISLEIGVAVPYLERDLEKLCEKELLIHKAGKYETAIIILTKEFSEEAYEKTMPAQRETAEFLNRFINENLAEIKAIGFQMDVNTDDNQIKWLMTCMIFGASLLLKHKESSILGAAKKYAGLVGNICGVEEFPSMPCGLTNLLLGNENGDSIWCMDFYPINTKEPDAVYFFHSQSRINIVLDIARGKSAGFSENDKGEIAELIKSGFVRKNGDELSLRFPVFTKEQYEKMMVLIDCAATDVAEKIRNIVNVFTDILVQHTPASMKQAADSCSVHHNTNCIVVPVKVMVDDGMLRPAAENEHPTTFVVLN
jgi:RNA polymerase sigma factor (sigma-70 family)